MVLSLGKRIARINKVNLYIYVLLSTMDHEEDTTFIIRRRYVAAMLLGEQ